MADFSILKQQIAAALPENTEGEITATIMVAQFWAAIDAINAAKADQGDLDDLALAVAGKADIFSVAGPLALVNGVLRLNYSGHGITLDQDGNLGVEAGYGLDFVDSTLVVATGDGIGIDDNGALQVLASRGIFMGGNGIEANIGWGLTWGGEAEDEIAVDDTAVQPIISDLATIRSGAAAGSTAYQLPADGIPATDLASAVQTSLGKADTAVQSATISTIVTLSQAEYDALADKDANTFYVII